MVKLMPGYVEDVAAWQARLEDLAAKGLVLRSQLDPVPAGVF